MPLPPSASLRRAYSLGDVRVSAHNDVLARRKHPTFTVQSAHDGADVIYVRPLCEAIEPLSANEAHLLAHLEVPQGRPILVHLAASLPPRYVAVAHAPEQLSSIHA